jgi:hypothetical protein
MKKVLISESDFKRLVRIILSESIIFPKILQNIFRNMDTAVKARTSQQVGVLMRNGEIDDFIIINKKKFKLTNPEQVLNNFIEGGTLTSKDSEKVFNIIFKNTEDPKEMQVMADFLMGEKEFFLKYRGKTKEQLMSELTPIYGQKQAQILSDKIIYKNLPKVVWSTFWEMNRESWASPNLWQSISKIITSKGDKAAWTALVRWFFTGTTRNVKKTFKDYLKLYESFGFSKPSIWALARLTASIGLEALQRWASASFVTTVIKMIVEFVRFQGTSTAEEKLTQNWGVITLDSFLRNWSGWDHNWFIPATAVVPAAIRFLEGLSRSMSWGQIYEYVINNEYPLVKDLISLENRIENKLPFVLS